MSNRQQENQQASNDHWPDMSRVWKQIGPPLRPSQQDLDFVAEEIHSWTQEQGVPRALILGVTPELYRLPWPEETKLMAVDHTQEMIDTLWPGPKESAICADWPGMPVESNSRDIVLCDGGLHLVDYPDGQYQLIKTLQRVIRPGGLCIFRLFAPPRNRETVQRVLKDLFNSKVPDLNILKLRLGMALQKNNTEGVALKMVWETLHQVAPDFERLAKEIDWPLEHLLAINAYRNSSSRYYFLTTDEVKDLFDEGFTLENVHVPGYKLGERCPTVVFRRTGS